MPSLVDTRFRCALKASMLVWIRSDIPISLLGSLVDVPGATSVSPHGYVVPLIGRPRGTFREISRASGAFVAWRAYAPKATNAVSPGAESAAAAAAAICGTRRIALWI